MTLWNWCRETGRTDVLAEAAARGRVFRGLSGPLAVGSREPLVWLAVWAYGGVVHWRPDGLSALGRWHDGPGDPAWPEDDGRAALIWPRTDGLRVFSHRAVWAAIGDTAALGAAGSGLPGPAGLIQGWASWVGGQPFGHGAWVRPNPSWPGAFTDGRTNWLYSDDLLGLWAQADDGVLETAEAVWYDRETGRVRSSRLFDGYWAGGMLKPMRAEPGGWHRMRG